MEKKLLEMQETITKLSTQINDFLQIINEGDKDNVFDNTKQDVNVAQDNLSSGFDLPNTLLSYGLSPSLKGFNYIIEAVEYISNNEDYQITKDVYPSVAIKYHTSSNRVERAIRHSVEIVCSKQSESFLNDFIAFNKTSNQKKFTNSEFLSILAFIKKNNQ